MLPLIDEVRPTASLGAPTKASCSRTRYPATEFFATVHDPAAWPLARGEAEALAVAHVDPLSLVHYKKVLVTKAAVAQIEELLK